MDHRLMINQSLQPVKGLNKQVQGLAKNQPLKQKSFKEILAGRLKEKTGVKFSKHAQDRILSRGIKVSENDLQQLKNGVEIAEKKGAHDSLIMVNKVAYVVSVRNKTVITAIDDQSLKKNLFTNIDSAVFM